MTSGISYIGLDVPRYVVTADTIATIQNSPAEKIRQGLLVNEFRFAGESDTVVTLAANNLLRFVEHVANNSELLNHYKRHRIRGIYLATETSVEGSRPLSMAVLEIVEPIIKKKLDSAAGMQKEAYEMLLEDFRMSDSFETKFACTALLKTIQLVNNSVELGTLEGALVIGTDIALYDSAKAKNAEATQGAASTLLYITRDPLLVKISANSTHYNLPTYDFYKPDEHTPRVPSGYGSEVAYVITVASAFKAFEEKFGIPEDFYAISHVPFPKEAYYLASILYVHLLRSKGKISELEQQLGEKEPIGNASNALELFTKVVRSYADKANGEDLVEHLSNSEEIAKLWAFHKKVRQTEGFNKFAREIGLDKAIGLPSRIGNSYNNSIIVALMSLLRSAEKIKPIIMMSYGSGAGSTVTIYEPLRIGKEAEKYMDISSLENRIEISIEEYKELHERLIRKNEFERGKEAYANSKTLEERDRQVLKNKFSNEGFKLLYVDESGRGHYAFNGEKVKSMPILRY